MKVRNILTYGIIILLMVSNRYLLFRINTIEMRIEENTKVMEGISTNMENEVNTIYEDMTLEFKKQASMFEHITVEMGELNIQNFMIPLEIRVMPKTIVEGMKVEVRLKEETLLMTQKDASFEVKTQVSIFDGVQPEEAKIVITENKKKTSETVNMAEYYNRKDQYLLEVEGGFSGKSSYGRDGDGKYSREGKIEIAISTKESNKVKELQYVRELNGEIIETKKLAEGGTNIEINDHVILHEKDKFIDYMLITDHYGLVYEYKLSAFEIDENGEPVKENPDLDVGVIRKIYDQKGTVLWNHKLK